MYYPNNEDRRHSLRVNHPFSFHYGEEVLEGRDFSERGLSVHYPFVDKEACFHFFYGQKLRDCYIQIEGQTFYFTRMRLARLEQEGDTIIYGIDIDHMLPPEQERYQHLHRQLQHSSADS